MLTKRFLALILSGTITVLMSQSLLLNAEISDKGNNTEQYEEGIVAAHIAVKEDLDIARQFQQSEKKFNMIAPIKNARAIMEVTGLQYFPDELDKSLARTLSELSETVPFEYIICPQCKGVGTVAFMQTANKRCPQCNGKRKVKKIMSSEYIASEIKLGREEYLRKITTQIRADVGNALVPSGVLKDQDLESKVRLKRLTAQPCRRCNGFGAQACSRCDGIGCFPCTAADCKGGTVMKGPSLTAPKATHDFLGNPKKGRRMEDVAIKLPSNCKECQGKGVLICSGCNGRAVNKCSLCSGTGNRDNCSACGGTGIGKCSRCEISSMFSTGERQCETCGNTGKAYCRICNGDGYSAGVGSFNIDTFDPFAVRPF